MANAGLRDEEKIKDGIRRADFVRKGMQGDWPSPGKSPSQHEADMKLCVQRSKRCEFICPFRPNTFSLQGTNPSSNRPPKPLSHLPAPPPKRRDHEIHICMRGKRFHLRQVPGQEPCRRQPPSYQVMMRDTPRRCGGSGCRSIIILKRPGPHLVDPHARTHAPRRTRGRESVQRKRNATQACMHA